jgi:hypothetical protein
VFDAPLMLPGTDKRRHGGLSRFSQTFRLNQEQFPISKFEEGFAALEIGASAEHILTAFCSAINILGEQLDSKSIACCLPQSFPLAASSFLMPDAFSDCCSRSLCRWNGNVCRSGVALSLPELS